ncbi:LacI family DNA-binding transcriptional regulator [Labedella endophytica]|nr:LacI family DNA-binding transcriptional regulator [Labedella endophytica]
MARPTLKDIAARAGVSVSTVSYALNEQSTMPLSDATKATIRRIAREIGYVPNGLARSLQARSSQTIGFLLDKPVSTPRYAAIVQGMISGLAERGFSLSLLNKAPASQWVDAVRGYRLDGLVFIGHDDHEVPTELAEPVAEHGIPFVALDCGAYEEERPYSTVDFDYGTGVEIVLAELERRGIRIVYYVRPELVSRSERIRERAVIDGLSRRPHMALRVVNTGITTERLRDFDTHKEDMASYPVELAQRVERTLREDGADPSVTALVCSWGADVEPVFSTARRRDDRFTIGSLAAGILSPALWPNLVYSRLPLDEAGRECARLIVAETESPDAHEHLLLPPALDAAS